MLPITTLPLCNYTQPDRQSAVESVQPALSQIANLQRDCAVQTLQGRSTDSTAINHSHMLHHVVQECTYRVTPYQAP